MDPYRSFLLEISHHLTRTEVQNLIFGFNIPKGYAEKIASSTDLFGYLEEQGLLKAGKFDELRKALLLIKRQDLVEKVDEHIRSQRNDGTGIQESNLKSHVDERKFHDHCEKNGYGVKVADGNHFSQNSSNFVELKVGNKFHLELHNDNENGCVADISFTRHDGSKLETLGIRLRERQGKVTIYGNSNADFVFNIGRASTSSVSSDHQFVEVTFNPEGYIIYFRSRELDGNSKNIFTEVMEVCIPKVKETKVGNVLKKLNMMYPNVTGSYFYYGQKILGAEDLLSLPLENHSAINPLLLLKQSERIAVKGVGSGQLQYIDASPLQCSLETITEQVCRLYNYDKCELKIDGEVVNAWIDCFKGSCVEVAQKSSPPRYRSLACSRGGSLFSSTRSSFGSRHYEEEFEDELEDLIGDLEMMPTKKLVSRSEAKENKSTLSRPGEASTSKEKMLTSSENKMVTCPDDKVVIRIYLVPSRSSPAL